MTSTLPIRWRLILGNFAEDSLPLPAASSGEAGWGEVDDALEFLYGREYGPGIRGDADSKRGGREASRLTVPAWVAKIRRLFPRRTVELLQKEALEKYHLTEILTDPEVLKTMEPNIDLLKNILTFKDIIPDEVKALVYDIAERAVRDIQKKLESEIRRVFSGKKLPNSNSPRRVLRNFDFKRTVRKNLKHYNEKYQTIVAEKLYFNENAARYNPWHVIILLDESGSMLDSVIYSAVMASIFSRLPFLSVKLVIFDTSLVDLSENLDDPAGILLKVQLGGGTDIHGALEYGRKLISAPQKTIVVLVSDLVEGGDTRLMYKSAADIIESGAKLLALTALDDKAQGAYDKKAAAHFARLGAHVAALTPDALAEWIATVIR